MKKTIFVGEKRLMNNEQYATCVAYRKPQNIDAQFEDGTIVKTTKCLMAK